MSEEKLSVRLEMHAKVASSRAHWADVNGEANDGFWKAFAADIESAAQLARRVEEAPSFTVERVVSAGLTWNGVDVTDFAEYGQRVRLVRVE